MWPLVTSTNCGDPHYTLKVTIVTFVFGIREM
jgi:hypothetical protein